MRRETDKLRLSVLGDYWFYRIIVLESSEKEIKRVNPLNIELEKGACLDEILEEMEDK